MPQPHVWLLEAKSAQNTHYIASAPLPPTANARGGLQMLEHNLTGEPGIPPWAEFEFPATHTESIEAIQTADSISLAVWRGGAFEKASGPHSGIHYQITARLAAPLVMNGPTVKGKIISTSQHHYMQARPKAMSLDGMLAAGVPISHAGPPFLSFSGPYSAGQEGPMVASPEAIRPGYLFEFVTGDGRELWVRVKDTPPRNRSVFTVSVVCVGEPAHQTDGALFVQPFPKTQSRPNIPIGSEFFTAINTLDAPWIGFTCCVEELIDNQPGDSVFYIARMVRKYPRTYPRKNQEIMWLFGEPFPKDPEIVRAEFHARVDWIQSAVIYLNNVWRENPEDEECRKAIERNQVWLTGFPDTLTPEENATMTSHFRTLHKTYERMNDESLPLRNRVNAAIHLSRCFRPFIQLEEVGWGTTTGEA